MKPAGQYVVDAYGLRLSDFKAEHGSYFLVHSAFVPGVTSVYDELLEPRGRALVRLPLTPREDDVRAMTFDQIVEAFLPHGCLPLALEVRTESGVEVLVNPPRTLRFERRVLGAVFAIGDRTELAETFAEEA